MLIKFLNLTLLRMGFFGIAYGLGEQKGPFPKIFHTYPTLVKLGTVIPCVKKLYIYESRDILLEFC